MRSLKTLQVVLHYNVIFTLQTLQEAHFHIASNEFMTFKNYTIHMALKADCSVKVYRVL